MSSAYIRDLKRSVDAAFEIERQTEATLAERFQSWFESLPEVSRARAFSMREMEQALQTQGKYLSPILLVNGWQRRRKWTSKSQYHRYWVPPGSQSG